MNQKEEELIMKDTICKEAIVQEETMIQKIRWKLQAISHKINTVYIGIALKIIRSAVKKSNIVAHAKREFIAAGYKKPDKTHKEDPNKWIQQNVIDLLSLFSLQGHSGSSAPFCIEYFKTLADYKPLSPITCDEDEWQNDECLDDDTYQNKRLSSIFKKSKNGKPYYLNAIVFRDQNGSCFTGNSVQLKDGSTIKSNQFIKLPFAPKTFYIDVIETEWADKEETIKKKGGGWWTFVVKDESQLEEVWKFYKKKNKYK